jgi:L-amino acid N-acyltransferase YncA
MTFIIRPAEKKDISSITAIYAHAVTYGTASFELEPPSEKEMMARYEDLVENGFPYLVTEQEGLILGYAYAGPFRMRRAYRALVEDSIYVDHNAQNKGVGKALLTSLLHSCEKLGFRQMVAVIGDSQSLGSIALHKALGFQPSGILKSTGWKHERWLDTVFMQRALGEAASTPLENF